MSIRTLSDFERRVLAWQPVPTVLEYKRYRQIYQVGELWGAQPWTAFGDDSLYASLRLAALTFFRSTTVALQRLRQENNSPWIRAFRGNFNTQSKLSLGQPYIHTFPELGAYHTVSRRIPALKLSIHTIASSQKTRRYSISPHAE